MINVQDGKNCLELMNKHVQCTGREELSKLMNKHEQCTGRDEFFRAHE